MFAIPNLEAVIVPPVCSNTPVQSLPYPTSNEWSHISVPPSNTNAAFTPVYALCWLYLPPIDMLSCLAEPLPLHLIVPVLFVKTTVLF